MRLVLIALLGMIGATVWGQGAELWAQVEAEMARQEVSRLQAEVNEMRMQQQINSAIRSAPVCQSAAPSGDYSWSYRQSGTGPGTFTVYFPGMDKKREEAYEPGYRGCGDFLLEPIPRNGDYRRYTTNSCDSVLKLTSCISDNALVRVVNYDLGTNVVCGVFVKAGETVKVRVPCGTCGIGYFTGDLWLGFDYGFKDGDVHVYPRDYVFTNTKGISLKIQSGKGKK